VAAKRLGKIKTTPDWGLSGQVAHLMRRASEEEGEEETELEMMPMIDITTLLLIFFLVSGIFMLQARIELPEAKTGSPLIEAGAKPVVLTVRALEGDPGSIVIAFEDEPNKPVQLEQVVGGYKKRVDNGCLDAVIIKAEKTTAFGTVERIMERLAEAGVADIRIGVEEPLR